MNDHKTIRIGGGAGFWGDSAEGPRQLVASGQIDFLILDYLAEITMSILSRARARDATLGYATDFPRVIAELAPQIKARGIKVVTNAGGVNPRACQAAIEQSLRSLGIDLRIGVVQGDDLLDRAASFQAQSVTEMFDATPFPPHPWSINAYLGAFPVAAALAAGADIVLTGRCVDSALVLGPLIHTFGWRENDLDLLAAGSLAGHVIECGCQATGGISTDWEAVADDWHRMGFPIAECAADGSFVLTRPRDSGGRIVPETVAEQIVYEIGDPGVYLLPDVTCDFRQVTLTQEGPDRVLVRGAKGRPPPADYKVSVTHQDGFRCTGTLLVGGIDAIAKARRVADALLRRTRAQMTGNGYADYRRTDVEILGAEANWGPHARAMTREVILKVALHHDDRNALEYFSREFFASATSMAQGITGFAGGRPAITPLIRLYSFLTPKAAVPIRVEVDGLPVPLPAASTPPNPSACADETGLAGTTSGSAIERVTPGQGLRVPLIALAYGRSGDKGNHANIGILARRAEFLPLLGAVLTADAVKDYFAHIAQGRVTRWEIPGLMGFNFLLENALGGGGVASLRYDPQGKLLAQVLMDFIIEIPRDWVGRGWVKNG
ncbi:MAG: DUF1446 domain-containing protein [Proteobacteria bacterium]|nr:DUF1446 domain-containing protein [Pseudomonadota bacterium]HQR04257.1 DUF1446 domain-containing protein [Rhodocyclaceae bacterium]